MQHLPSKGIQKKEQLKVLNVRSKRDKNLRTCTIDKTETNPASAQAMCFLETFIFNQTFETNPDKNAR
jgi:hypothetical protein